MKLILPSFGLSRYKSVDPNSSYLTYSAVSLWMSSEKSFRKRYYYGEPNMGSRYMDYGTAVGNLLETDPDHFLVKDIPRYDTPERELCSVVDGVPFISKVDSFDSNTGNFLEYKTGKAPWTKSKVYKHIQLDIYALLLDAVDGYKQDRTATLVWIPTQEIDGVVSRIGDCVSTTRIITDADKTHIRETIVRVANEISHDYQLFVNNI